MLAVQCQNACCRHVMVYHDDGMMPTRCCRCAGLVLVTVSISMQAQAEAKSRSRIIDALRADK